MDGAELFRGLHFAVMLMMEWCTAELRRKSWRSRIGGGNLSSTFLRRWAM